jgi:hypothetical protein
MLSYLITIITLLFSLAIAFDISPYIRGPAPYPPEWRWEYLFTNTLDKIYFPIIIIALLLFLLRLVERKKLFLKKGTIWFLIIIILLSYIFQLSILFFSRAGITVLIHRIINPELNSYFTASLIIKDVPDFLHNYYQYMQHFIYHAKSHPPGAILFFYYIHQILSPFPIFESLAAKLNPIHSDVKAIWNTLLPSDKATAIFSAFFIPFLSSLAIIPLYCTAKMLYGIKIAIRCSFLYFLIPSMIFFIPINDAFLHIFSITALLFTLKGLRYNYNYYVVSGFTLFIGVFFNLSLLPLFIFFYVFILLNLLTKKVSLKNYIKISLLFYTGFLFTPIMLFVLFRYNFIEMMQMIMKSVPHVYSRSYILWIFYNLFDYFIFAGIPTTIIFFLILKQLFFNIYNKIWKKVDILSTSFFIMLLITNFSGSVRGETARIWIPYIPLMTLATTSYITKDKKFSTKAFVWILSLQAIQILIMQEFWVMLW